MPVARALANAKITGETELLDALQARREQLQMSNSDLESAAGLCSGHVQKVTGPSRERSPSLQTIDKLMGVLGLSFVLIVDPEKVARAALR